jgi:hypothetical protein
VAEVLGARSVESDSTVHRYQETPSIHIGVGGTTAPLVFTRRVVGDIAPR